MSDSRSDGSLASADISLLETGNLADATIVCGDRTWKVHKVIVGSRCKWFLTAFYGKMAEAASGKVLLEEQDPDLIDILLRFIYAKDINIPSLKDGKDVPALCVRIFRVSDFFLLDELKEKALQELKKHMTTRLRFIDTQRVDGKIPTWLTEVLDALEEAYMDHSTEPVVEILLQFVRLNKHKIFQFKVAVVLLDRIPEIARDLMKSYLTGDMAAAPPRTHGFRLGLPVHAALHSTDQLYELRTCSHGQPGSTTLPCQLYPVVNDPYAVFTAVNPITDEEVESLHWIVPDADDVKRITSHDTSDVVRVDMNAPDDSKLWVYVRFDDRNDASVFVERYCRANPEIKSIAASSATTLSGAMRMRLARVAGTS